ncbi:cupin domain-containing protein [Pseudomonas mandelii]|uniref:cupin domain-containing protein n=1 Tax=Pseudomonas mandelii TaxID=75612 RepID=UPI00398CC5FF
MFEVTKGRFCFTYPFSELATLIEGEIEITDESGNSVTYEGGDGRSWFIRKGATVIWDVKSEKARKSFFSATTDI